MQGMDPIKAFFLKYRQGGVSTFWLLYWLDNTIFNANTVTGILADKRENLGYLFEIVRLAHQTMPPELQPKLGQDSKSVLSFPDTNSKIMVSLSIKATALHNLHISEWCYCKDEEIARTLAACSPEANITGESTGNGVGNHGYELYQDGKKNENAYKTAFYPWFIQDEYYKSLNGIDPNTIQFKQDEKRLIKLAKKDYSLDIRPEQILWRRDKIKEQKGLFPQEFPETDEDAFLMSGEHFFNPKKIHKLIMESKEYVKDNPPYMVDQNEQWVAYEQPMKGHVYVAGGDTSEGANDFSYLKIICCTCRQEAFWLQKRCGVDVFYRDCDYWGRMYQNALLAIERNNHGHAVLLGLTENCRYPNLYKHEKKRKIINVLRGSGNNPVQNSEKLGWETSKITKPIMLDDLKLCFEGNSDDDEFNFQPEITALDTTTLSEMLTFQEIDGKLQAIEGKFDDGVIATSIAVQMYKRSRKYASTAIVKTKQMEGYTPGIIFGNKREIR